MTDDDPRPTFVLGVGAQKAGTTWLYQYLAGAPEFVEGFRKEYHVFDALDLPSESWTRRRVFDVAEKSLAALRDHRPADAGALHRIAMLADDRLYYDYFAGLLARGTGRAVTADVTPAYALLSAARMAQIRSEFADRGVRTRAIFLMRDPVDRLWSQVRMQRRRSTQPLEGTDEEALLRLHSRPQLVSRSEYHRTVACLDEAFGGDAHYEFYESLFSDEAVGRICAALGIEAHAPEPDARVNAAPEQDDLSVDAVRHVATSLAPVYEHLAVRFPEVDLRALWPSAVHVL